jgi:RimJ/RimL family protein N-acetyltransferase
VVLSSIATERLILRHWRESDGEPFARLNANVRVMEYMPHVLSREESDALADRIEGHFRQHGFGLCAVEDRSDGTFIGFIGLSVPTFHAQGFETLGLDELVSFTVPRNTKSRRVMEKLGMAHDPSDDFDHPRLPEGHFLRRHVLYRLRRSGWSNFQILSAEVLR